VSVDPAPAIGAARPHDRLPAGPDPDEAPVFLPEGALPLDGKELCEFDIFRSVSPKDIDSLINRHQIRKRQAPIWLRQFKKGEVICREGEYGSTAFYIVQGSVQVRIAAPMGHLKSWKDERAKSGIFGLVRRFASTVLPASKDPRDAKDGRRRWIPADASVLLEYGNPVADLGAGAIFGEMSCLSFYPRSATVIAAEDGTECLEMLRSALDFLKQKSKAMKERIETLYRDRVLDRHLSSVPMLAGLTKEFLDDLRPRVEFVQFEPGTPIVREGDAADAFYLIRIGFVRVSQKRPGGELVLRYLGPSEYFGEVGLLVGGKRVATCTALDHVEAVRIKKEDFDRMLRTFPEIERKLRASAEAIVAEKGRRFQTAMAQAPLGDFLLQGLMNAQNVLLIDLEKCVRCDDCVHACADAHDGVTRLVRDGLRFDRYLVATSCRACTDPVCMIGCPVSSIRRRDSLEILIEDWCIGCGKCADQCPYGNINMHKLEERVEDPGGGGKTVTQVVNKGKGKAVCCDLCQGMDEPSCVYGCPHGAAMRVRPAEFFAPRLFAAGASDTPSSGGKARLEKVIRF
jgi:CRP-like cAMP-binding protein/Fe-S-cluster-containing hydrogenase component 2